MVKLDANYYNVSRRNFYNKRNKGEHVDIDVSNIEPLDIGSNHSS